MTKQMHRHAYLPHIDGLRAIAVSAVVLYHAFPALLPGGFIGVDVFFVISGFLITRLIVDEIETGEFSLLKFYERRVRRLLPAATLMMVVTFILAAWVMLPEQFRDFGKSLAAAALFYSNIYFRKNVGYFDGPADEKPLLHTWSLSVEEQFYVIWPLLLLLAARYLPRKITLIGVGVLLIASLTYSQIHAYKGASSAFYLVQSRFWELGLGALLALLGNNVRITSRPVAEAMAAAGLIGIIASLFFVNASVPFPGLAAFPACAGTALVIWSTLNATDRSPRLTTLLTSRPFLFTGLISYSLYLWHWPVLSIARQYAQRSLSVTEIIALVTLSIILATLSWRFVERPFRKPAGAIPDQSARTVTAGVATIAATALIGGTISWGHGWAWRWDPITRAVANQIAQSNPVRRSCDGYRNILINNETCRWGPAPKKGHGFELALFGDSNADHFADLAQSYAEELKRPGRQVTHSACAMIFGMTVKKRGRVRREKCTLYQRRAWEWLQRNPNLKLAIISANWQSYPFSSDKRTVSTNGLPLHPDTAKHAAKLNVQNTDARYYILSSVLHFRAMGADVHIIGQIPYFFRGKDKMPVRCIVSAVTNKTPTDVCGTPASKSVQPLAPANRFFRQLADYFPEVTAAFPTDALCDDKLCAPYKDGAFLYRDPGHLNRFGARYLARVMPKPRLLGGR